jgi:hypothetical protein
VASGSRDLEIMERDLDQSRPLRDAVLDWLPGQAAESARSFCNSFSKDPLNGRNMRGQWAMQRPLVERPGFDPATSKCTIVPPPEYLVYPCSGASDDDVPYSLVGMLTFSVVRTQQQTSNLALQYFQPKNGRRRYSQPGSRVWEH